MTSEGYDDEVWGDADFMEAVEEAVELASAQHNHHRLPPPPPPPPEQKTAATSSHLIDISFSPPRKLSQTNVNQESTTSTSQDSSNTALEQEIGRLKGELDRVSELLAQKEQECFTLRKETDKKEINVVQKERVTLSTKSTGESDFSSMIKKKLLEAWESSTGKNLGRFFGSKLLETCEADFRTLFGFLDSSFPSKSRIESSLSNSRAAKDKDMPQDHFSVSAKVSRLYSVLTKISNEMIRMDGLLNALIDLCRHNNRDVGGTTVSHSTSAGLLEPKLMGRCAAAPPNPVCQSPASSFAAVQLSDAAAPASLPERRLEDQPTAPSTPPPTPVLVIYSALHILHEVLRYSYFTERKDDRRSNVIVEEIDENGSSRRGSHSKETLYHNHVIYGARLNNSGDTFSRMGPFNPETEVFTSCFNYLSLFELMCQIIMTNDLENIRWEAVSIMNLILVRNHTYLEREKFGSDIAFESVSKLLTKESGCRVHKQAVRLLYLLLNCPNIMVSFFNTFMEGNSIVTAGAKAKTSAASQVIFSIFEGLGNCLSCSGKSAEVC